MTESFLGALLKLFSLVRSPCGWRAAPKKRSWYLCVGDSSRQQQGTWQHVVSYFDPNAADGYGHGQLIPPLCVCGSPKSCPHLASGGVAQAIQGTRVRVRHHPIYLVTRRLLLVEDLLAGFLKLLAGLFNLLAGVFEVRLRLFALALMFSALVAGYLAERFLGLTAKILDLVLRLIRITHSVSAPSLFVGMDRVTANANRSGGQPIREKVTEEGADGPWGPEAWDA